MNLLLMVVCVAAALGSGIIAGVFFAFSAFIMQALRRCTAEQGAAAMQWINLVILRSLFIPVFFGTALIGLAAAAVACWRWHTPGSPLLLGGVMVYLVGVIGVTIAFNVPLNNALAAVKPGSAEFARVWTNYLVTWTRWNHVRTLASAAACVMFILATTYH